MLLHHQLSQQIDGAAARRDADELAFEIHDGGACYVIAEVGHNHQGDLQQAKDLIDAAKDCGADAVKLQKRANHSLYTREFYEQPYDNEFSFGRTYGEHREALEAHLEKIAGAAAYVCRNFTCQAPVTDAEALAAAREAMALAGEQKKRSIPRRAWRALVRRAQRRSGREARVKCLV